jgi:hypothetical protein
VAWLLLPLFLVVDHVTHSVHRLADAALKPPLTEVRSQTEGKGATMKITNMDCNQWA